MEIHSTPGESFRSDRPLGQIDGQASASTLTAKNERETKPIKNANAFFQTTFIDTAAATVMAMTISAHFDPSEDEEA